MVGRDAPPHTTLEARRRHEIRDNACEFNGLEGSTSAGGVFTGPEWYQVVWKYPSQSAAALSFK